MAMNVRGPVRIRRGGLALFWVEAAHLDDIAGAQKIFIGPHTVDGENPLESTGDGPLDGPPLHPAVRSHFLELEHRMGIDGLVTNDSPLYPDRFRDIDHANRVMRP